MSRQALWIVVVAVALAAGAVWFFGNFERVPDKEWTGYQGEARRNSFLAAERLLDRMGVRVRHLKTPIELRELAAERHADPAGAPQRARAGRARAAARVGRRPAATSSSRTRTIACPTRSSMRSASRGRR